MPDTDDRADAPSRRRTPSSLHWVLTAGILGLTLIGVAVLVIVAITGPTQDITQPTTPPTSSPAFPAPETVADCPPFTVTVTTARELQATLDAVSPGTVIGLAPAATRAPSRSAAEAPPMRRLHCAARQGASSTVVACRADTCCTSTGSPTCT